MPRGQVGRYTGRSMVAGVTLAAVVVLVVLVARPWASSPGEAPGSPALGSPGTSAPSPSGGEDGDEREARLAALRAGTDFLEFAEHTRAARAPHARLAWENFAPIVDGERVEWTNKAALWDAIAPAIRDEALLLGPEYRQPLWDNTNAIPNSVSMAWSNSSTEGRGQYVEFSATYSGTEGPVEQFWGFLVVTDELGHGRVVARMPPFGLSERDFGSFADQQDEVQRRAWAWIERQERRG